MPLKRMIDNGRKKREAKFSVWRTRRRLLLRRLKKAWGKLYGPWARVSARFLDYLAGDERRRLAASIVLALSLNLIVLTIMSVFARVRIWIPNAPSDTINVTLVEMLPRELPLRDPEITPEPEPEPEIAEEPEPEPVVEPEPEPVVEQEPETPPPPEPEVVEQPEPEPEIKIDLEPQFAPPAEEPEPLIPNPAPAAQDDLSLPEPEEEPVEQTPEEEATEPLVSVEPEAQREAGLDDLLGQEEGKGEDAAGEEIDAEKDEQEKLLAEQPPQNDDMFDEPPSFSGRTFILPQAQLPMAETPAQPGSSGVVAIYCPKEFTDADKIAECAGRPEIRSGWRPGASGEDWSRATALLKGSRERGEQGPTIGPAAETFRQQRDVESVEALGDPRRSQDSVNNLADTVDDNLMRGVEGDRPNIGPKPFEPNWTLRERPKGVRKKDLEDLRKAAEEDGENKEE